MPLAVPPSRRRWLAIALLALLTSVATVVLLSRGTDPASADLNPNNTICYGHLGKGEPEADDPGSTQVAYTFACSGPITGYQVQPDHEIQSIETEVFATDAQTKAVVPTDSFSCNGDIPGFGVNCVGKYAGSWHVVSGRFSINEKLCAEPRTDALLTVVYAYKDSKGDVQQAMAGPFGLGRPQGCPKSRTARKPRIPRDVDVPAPY